MEQDKKLTFKFIIVGGIGQYHLSLGVGKSCLLLRFAKDKFYDLYDPTLGIEYHTKDIVYKKEELKVKIWDTVLLL